MTEEIKLLQEKSFLPFPSGTLADDMKTGALSRTLITTVFLLLLPEWPNSRGQKEQSEVQKEATLSYSHTTLAQNINKME